MSALSTLVIIHLWTLLTISNLKVFVPSLWMKFSFIKGGQPFSGLVSSPTVISYKGQHNYLTRRAQSSIPLAPIPEHKGRPGVAGTLAWKGKQTLEPCRLEICENIYRDKHLLIISMTHLIYLIRIKLFDYTLSAIYNSFYSFLLQLCSYSELCG